MELGPRRHRHPNDPRTSAGWVQLTNHSGLIAIANEVAPHCSEPECSRWRCPSRPCPETSTCTSESDSIWKRTRAQWFNICLTSWKRKYILFGFSLQADLVFLWAVFPSLFSFFFLLLLRSPSGSIEWFPSLSPTEGCCCRLIACKLDFAPVWRTH